MKKILMISFIVLTVILFNPQFSFATETTITLVPGHNYIVEGIAHPWDEELHGVQPEQIGYPVVEYKIGALANNTSYDLYKYDGFSSMLAKNAQDEISVSFEVSSSFDGENLKYTLSPGGKTYFTISTGSPQTVLKYRSDIIKISETNISTLYSGTLEPGKTYEFTCKDDTTDIESIDFNYIRLAFESDITLIVNEESREFVATTSQIGDYLDIDKFSNSPSDENSTSSIIKTTIKVPITAKVIKYYAPGENFSKYASVKIINNPSTVTNQAIKVLLDGISLDFDVPPAIINGRTMVPLRTIFDAMGADIKWDNDTKTVTAIKGDITITLTIGSKTATVNGRVITLDAPGTVVNSRTLVPAKFIAESLGAKVEWKSEFKEVIITSK